MDTKRAIYNFLSRPIYLFSVLSVLFALAAALPPISPNLLGNRWFDTSALELTTVPQTWGFAAALFILWVSNGMVFIKLFFHRSFQGRKRPRGLESFARSLQLRVTRGTSLGHHEFLCESIRKY